MTLPNSQVKQVASGVMICEFGSGQEVHCEAELMQVSQSSEQAAQSPVTESL